MRMLRSLGRNETDRLFGDLMSGRTSLAREARLAARARTDRGEGDDKIITLGKDANGESRFGLGITLVHEAFRDGEIGDDQAGETERAVLGHVDAAQEVMNGYGKQALGAAQRREVQYIRFMQAMGDNAKISEYVKGKYDSSADYWKVISNGDIVFDGKKDLYDEDGNLLRRYEGTGNGGFTASLAEHLGVSKDEARNLRIAAGFVNYNSDERTFYTKDGQNVMNNKNHAIESGVNFAARYFIQRDYIDKINEYGGSMTGAVDAAVQNAEKDFMNALRYGTMTPEIAAQYNAARSMKPFAQRYDASVLIYGSRSRISPGIPSGLLNGITGKSYDSTTINAANRRIRNEWSKTDANPLYSLIEDGTVSPIVGHSGERLDVGRYRKSGKPTYITTWAFYPKDNEDLIKAGLAGKPHGQWRGGLGVDMGTLGKPLPLVLIQPETILAQSKSVYRSDSLGNVVKTETPSFRKLSAHLA